MSKTKVRLVMHKRQQKLQQLMSRPENNTATYADLAEQMRRDPWVAELWPEYSVKQVAYDYHESMALVTDDIRAMAGVYLLRHVEQIDAVTETLIDFVEDTTIDLGVRIAAANSARGYIELSSKILGTQSAQQIDVNKRTFRFNIDDFAKLAERANKAKKREADIVDGEFTE
jgi:hypothetical protein